MRSCHLCIALFAWLISHQPIVLFSQNKPATNNQPAILFSQNKSASAISHQRCSSLYSSTRGDPEMVAVDGDEPRGARRTTGGTTSGIVSCVQRTHMVLPRARYTKSTAHHHLLSLVLFPWTNESVWYPVSPIKLRYGVQRGHTTVT
jgi:hypothetical protein